jgi:hypothetical protein
MSVEYGIVTSVVPPGGWHYQQVLSSGQTVRILGFSFEQLISNLIDFRRRHSDLCGGAARAEVVNVRADIKDYYCKNFRQNCADAASSPTVQSGGIGVTNYVSPINKAADWLATVGNMRIERVDAALAAQRAQVCAQCSQNVGWRTSCGPCNDNIFIRTQNAKGSLATPFDRNLGVCRVFGHMNEVAVYLTDTHSTPQQQPPSHCWKVTEHGI